jgi:glycosyltransferase involved in cell wall biosynthesis
VVKEPRVKMSGNSEKPSKKLSDKRIVSFIVWAPHSARATSLAERLNARLHLLHWKFRKKSYALFKYRPLAEQTKRILIEERPEIVFAQIPPIFCASTSLDYCRDTRSRLVVDVHTGAFDTIWSVFRSKTIGVLQHSTLALVSNDNLAKMLNSKQIRSFVLEDPLPKITLKSKRQLKDGTNIAVISSFGSDEPLSELLKTADKMSNVNFHITGDLKFARREYLKTKRENVVFTDFLDYDSYISLLNSVDAIIVLTRRENTLLSGGYEALALGKPLITSSTTVLLNYFSKGTVHVNNTSNEIIKAIEKVTSDKVKLGKEMEELRLLKEKEWEIKFNELKGILDLT